MKRVIAFISAMLAAVLLMSSCTPEPPVHRHEFESEWSFDDVAHRHKCKDASCTEVSDETAHTLGEWTVVKEPTSDAEGEREAKCDVCGYARRESLPALGGGDNGGGDAVTGGMSEAEWKKLFTFTNVRAKYTSRVMGETSEIKYAIDGDGALVDYGFGEEYVGSDEVALCDFSENFADFRYTGTAYEAELVTLSDGEMTVELSEVRITVDGDLLLSVSYSIDLGSFGSIDELYEFYDHGKVKITPPEEKPAVGPMSNVQYKAAQKAENFKNFAFEIFDTNGEYDFLSATGVFDGDTAYTKCEGYLTESGEVKYEEFSGTTFIYASEVLDDVLAVLGKLTVEDFVYDSDFEQYHYDGMQVFDGFAISDVWLVLEESRIAYVEYTRHADGGERYFSVSFSEYGVAELPSHGNAGMSAAEQKAAFADSLLKNVTVYMTDVRDYDDWELRLADGKYSYDLFYGYMPSDHGNGRSSLGDEVAALLKIMRELDTAMIVKSDGEFGEFASYYYLGTVTYKGVADRQISFEVREGRVERIIIGRYEYAFSEYGTTVI